MGWAPREPWARSAGQKARVKPLPRNWPEIRAAVLREEPHCRACARLGLSQPSVEVDHIIARAHGGSDDRSNLQGLCGPCHAAKTQAERGPGGTPKQALPSRYDRPWAHLYDAQWRRQRAYHLKLHPLCELCRRRGLVAPAAAVSHKVPHHGDERLFRDPDNLQALCNPCHERRLSLGYDERQVAAGHGASARPEWLPQARCRVSVVCGPPGSGKSTYVEQHRGRGDTVIDLDMIKAELSGEDLYYAGDDWVAFALRERNRQLAALAEARPEHVAWLIVSGAGLAAREWWRRKLGAAELVLLDVPAAECRRRVLADARRPEPARQAHLRAIDAWWAKESRERAG